MRKDHRVALDDPFSPQPTSELLGPRASRPHALHYRSRLSYQKFRAARSLRAGRPRSSNHLKDRTCDANSRPVDAIDQDVGLKDSCIPFEFFAQTFSNSYRRTIFRMDQTNDVRLIEFIEPIFEPPASGFSRVPFPPNLSLERPANLNPGPA